MNVKDMVKMFEIIDNYCPSKYGLTENCNRGECITCWQKAVMEVSKDLLKLDTP